MMASYRNGNHRGHSSLTNRLDGLACLGLYLRDQGHVPRDQPNPYHWSNSGNRRRGNPPARIRRRERDELRGAHCNNHHQQMSSARGAHYNNHHQQMSSARGAYSNNNHHRQMSSARGARVESRSDRDDTESEYIQIQRRHQEIQNKIERLQNEMAQIEETVRRHQQLEGDVDDPESREGLRISPSRFMPVTMPINQLESMQISD